MDTPSTSPRALLEEQRTSPWAKPGDLVVVRQTVAGGELHIQLGLVVTVHDTEGDGAPQVDVWVKCVGAIPFPQGQLIFGCWPWTEDASPPGIGWKTPKAFAEWLRSGWSTVPRL